MATGEKGPTLIKINFPEEIPDDLLANLKNQAEKTRSLRVAIAHQIESESQLFADLARKHFPEDKQREVAVKEYTGWEV